MSGHESAVASAIPGPGFARHDAIVLDGIGFSGTVPGGVILCPPVRLVDVMEDPLATSGLPLMKQFRLQPIYDWRANTPFGYEVLYRGQPQTAPPVQDWRKIDYNMVALLSTRKVNKRLFVNLANETILNIPEEVLKKAAHNNDLIFEWTETLSDDHQFGQLVDRINRWLGQGLRFVIDDYGYGRDGLQRLKALRDMTNVVAVKFDGSLLRTMDTHHLAADAVTALLAVLKRHNIASISECVEGEEDFERSKEMGFDMVQGFFIDGGEDAALIAS